MYWFREGKLDQALKWPDLYRFANGGEDFWQIKRLVGRCFPPESFYQLLPVATESIPNVNVINGFRNSNTSDFNALVAG